MRRLKFFTLFRTLREDEVVAFQKYLKRAHENDDVALRVFAHLKKIYPGFQKGQQPELSDIYRKVFGAGIEEDEYNRKKLLNALSDLHLWLKAFILSEKVNDDSFESRFLWLTVLKERGLDHEFTNSASMLQTALNDLSVVPGVVDYGKRLAVSQFVYNHLTTNNSIPQSEAFSPFANHLDLYYAVAKLKMACEMVSMKNMNRATPDFLLTVPAVSDFPALADHPLLLLYQEVYHLLTSRHGEHYSKVETLVAEYAGKIDPVELGVILIYLRNYASPEVRKGEPQLQLWERTHRLNKIGVEHGIFARKGAMTTTEFHNIVNAAGIAEDFGWAEWFIETRSRFLPADIRDLAVLLANAMLSFEKKEFSKILKELERVNVKEMHDLYLLIRLRTMMLRCYYELHADQNTIMDYCTSFEKQLYRMPKPREEAVTATFNFMLLLKMLARKTATKELVLKKIESTDPCFFKPWLSEKAAAYREEFATRRRGK